MSQAAAFDVSIQRMLDKGSKGGAVHCKPGDRSCVCDYTTVVLHEMALLHPDTSVVIEMKFYRICVCVCVSALCCVRVP